MINVVGLGYIGLPTALILASHNIKVVGTDINKEIVQKLNNKTIVLEEHGMTELYKIANSKDIYFSCDCISTKIYIITVPTPFNNKNKKIDPQFIITAVKNILDVCMEDSIIIIESTVSPGTIDRYIRPILEKSNKKVNLAHAPERIIPGNMIYELKNNSRTIGADNVYIADEVKKIYESFCVGEIVLTDIRTAEMTKVIENTYRDVNIAFANELLKICRSDNMDVYEIIKIANKHPRVNILSPGPGVGGHCISVDPWFLVGDYPELTNMILTARKINDSMPEYVIERIYEIIKENNIMSTSKVGIYGLTYKEDVDDIRESPTLQLLKFMEKHLANSLKVYDPYVKGDVVENQYHDFESFLNDIVLIVIMVAHSEIKDNIDAISRKLILDTKNIVTGDNVYTL